MQVVEREGVGLAHFQLSEVAVDAHVGALAACRNVYVGRLEEVHVVVGLFRRDAHLQGTVEVAGAVADVGAEHHVVHGCHAVLDVLYGQAVLDIEAGRQGAAVDGDGGLAEDVVVAVAELQHIVVAAGQVIGQQQVETHHRLSLALHGHDGFLRAVGGGIVFHSLDVEIEGHVVEVVAAVIPEGDVQAIGLAGLQRCCLSVGLQRVLQACD